MKKIIVFAMLASIVGIGALIAMNYSYYRGGTLQAEVQAMRDKQEDAKRREREAREAQLARPAENRQRAQQPRAQNSGGQNQNRGQRFDVNPARLFGDITLTDHQKSQADTIVKEHRESISAIRRQQRDAQDLTRLSMLSDLIKNNGGKIPDPAWNDLGPAELAAAIEAHADVKPEAKQAVAGMMASWQSTSDQFTSQMRAARDAANGRLLELLSAEQRAQYDTANPRTADAK